MKVGTRGSVLRTLAGLATVFRVLVENLILDLENVTPDRARTNILNIYGLCESGLENARTVAAGGPFSTDSGSKSPRARSATRSPAATSTRMGKPCLCGTEEDR